LTEIPEHLLKRSRERRGDLAGSGSQGSADSGTGDAPTAQPTTPASVPANAAPAEVAQAAPPAPVAPYNAAAAARPKIPWWAAGTLVLLPIWAIAYVGTLERPPQEVTGVLATGDHVYAARCASCHGATGGGGSGHALADGEVLVTFPTPAEHIVWVAVGSDGVGLGNRYGDAARGRVVEGGMPAWGSVLTTEELIGVVLHERARLSGSDTDLALAEAIDHSSHAGELDLSGHLDPATVTVDEVTELLESAAHDLDSQLAAG